MRLAVRSIAYLSFFSLAILCFTEIFLRLLGYEPYKQSQPGGAENARRLDPELGWVLLPGHYEVGPFNDTGDSMSITVKQDTGRVTRMDNEGVGPDQVTFLGGSFIMGHALDDHETAVWKLQQRFRHIDFRNLAISAYGTYQSLMVLEKELKKGNRPKCVVYGAIQHHELRNVAEGGWLVSLRREIPYVSYRNDSTFERAGTVAMINLFLTQTLASAYLAEKALNKMLSYDRIRNARQVSFLLIKEMQRLCDAHHIAFYVAPLHYDVQGMHDLTHFLEANKIDYIDCNVALTPENVIKDDGHPGPAVNDIWASRIARRFVTDGILK